MIRNKKLIKSSTLEDAFTVYPWSNECWKHSDHDLGLSYAVEAYGEEFLNLDDSTLNDLRDTLITYFDDEAYVRDWNINYPDDQIEEFSDIMTEEDLSNEELARYFDYERYGRDIRLENNMIWDNKRECWFSGNDTDDYDIDDVTFLGSSKGEKGKKVVKSARKLIKSSIEDINFYNAVYEALPMCSPSAIDEIANIVQTYFDEDEYDSEEDLSNMVYNYIDDMVATDQFTDETVKDLLNAGYIEEFNVDDDVLERINITSSHKPIKSAVDGGWRVDSSDVPEALDLFVEYVGEETALEAIARAMGSDVLEENIEYVAQQWDIAEDIEDLDAWEAYEKAKEIMGASELFTNLTQAAGYDELAEDLAFIFRQYDFREWNKYDDNVEEE